jgi:hypothetical protein
MVLMFGVQRKDTEGLKINRVIPGGGALHWNARMTIREKKKHTTYA